MEVAGSSTQAFASEFQSGIANERLVSMKRTRSYFFANMSRLQGELDILLLDINNRKEATEKNNALHQCFSNFFMPSPPFHARYVVFAPQAW